MGLISCCLAVILAATGLAPAAATADPGSWRLELPAPTGPAELGTISLQLIDQGRQDPFAPGKQRELMIQLWYPTVSNQDHGFAPCIGARIAPDFFGAAVDCRAHARESVDVDRRTWLFGVPLPVRKNRSYPVVLYSPDYGSTRAFGTTLVEELASQGFIVVAIDHPYDAAAVEFPDGRVTHITEIEEGPTDLASWDRLSARNLAVRVDDVEFVLDSLQRLQNGENPSVAGDHIPDNLAGALDLSRVGMVGHAMGGSTAAAVLGKDNRLKAAMLLESPVPPSTRESGLARPILSLQAGEPDIDAAAKSWELTPKSGWNKALRLKGSGYNTFTDLAVICGQLGPNCDPAAMALGTIDGERAIAIQRAYTVAFFDQHLAGRSTVDRLAERYPEIQPG